MAQEIRQPYCDVDWDQSRQYQTPRKTNTVLMDTRLFDIGSFDFSSPGQRARKRATIYTTPRHHLSSSSSTLSFHNMGAVEGLKMLSSPPLSETSVFSPSSVHSANQYLDQYVGCDAGAASPNRLLFPEAFGNRHAPTSIYAGIGSGANVGGLMTPLGWTPEKMSQRQGLARDAFLGSRMAEMMPTPTDSSKDDLVERVNKVNVLPPSPEYVVGEGKAVQMPTGREYVYFLPTLIAQGVHGGMIAKDLIMKTVERVLRSADEIGGHASENLEIRLRYCIDWDGIREDHQPIMDAFLVGFTHAFEVEDHPKHRYDIMKISSARAGAFLKNSLQENASDPDCVGIIAAGSYWLPYEESLESVMTFLKSDDQFEVDGPRFLYLVQDHPCAPGAVKDCKTGKTLFYKKHWPSIFRTQARLMGPPPHLIRPCQLQLDPAALRSLSEELKELNPSPCYDHYIRKGCKNCFFGKCRFSDQYVFDEVQLYALWSLYAKCPCTAGANCRDMGCPKKHC
ncbi:hypothetical protein BJ508DRAFT_362788 [Ascobolus immersus RN42]|uniref:Uncharacterized protein n=1 Tax=Ascobolus immersus RN42 TaxID=1160509 RepID=A0A3N4I3K8_ASCIM|nr:hypothetical protein BJ508DRAFT_362788 [Ascobolus immersus RN42]